MRALARATKISKSSVHRISQRIEHRHQHPESYFWETAEGYQWLRLLVFAVDVAKARGSASSSASC